MWAPQLHCTEQNGTKYSIFIFCFTLLIVCTRGATNHKYLWRHSQPEQQFLLTRWRHWMQLLWTTSMWISRTSSYMSCLLSVDLIFTNLLGPSFQLRRVFPLSERIDRHAWHHSASSKRIVNCYSSAASQLCFNSLILYTDLMKPFHSARSRSFLRRN